MTPPVTPARGGAKMSSDDHDAIVKILQIVQDIKEDIDGIKSCLKEDEGRIQQLEIGQRERQTQITELKKHDEKLDVAIVKLDERIDEIVQRTGWWNGANTFGALIAGIMAWFKN